MVSALDGLRRGRLRHHSVSDDELGSGLVELLLAGVLGMLGLAVVVTVVRGPLAAPLRPPPLRADAVPPVVRDVVVGAVRTARATPMGPAVLAAGIDHLVLRAGTDDEWWRLTLAEGEARVDHGRGPHPGGPAPPGVGRLVEGGPEQQLTVVLRGRDGVAVDPAASPLATAVLIEIAPSPSGEPVSVGLRGGR